MKKKALTASEYQKQYYQKNREKILEKSRLRHEKNKHNLDYQARRLLRYTSWRKHPDVRSKRAALYKEWAERNRQSLLERKARKARDKRRESPTFGLTQLISECRESGDLKRLIEGLESALTKHDPRRDKR